MNGERKSVIMSTCFNKFLVSNTKFIWWLLLGVGLLGCVPQGGVVGVVAGTVPVTRGVIEEEATAVPVVRPSPTNDNALVDGTASPLTPTPIGSNVYCGDLTEGVEGKSYWVDDIISGESTIEELLQVIEDLPEEKKPIQYGESGFGNPEEEDYYLLIFDKDVLFSKYEPRTYLWEIISYYGHPTEVTWRLVKRTNSSNANVARVDKPSLFFPKSNAIDTESVDTTRLYFPQSNAIFIAEGQLTSFYADTEFSGIISTPDFYEEDYDIINNQPDRYFQVIQFPWPCG